VRTRLIAGNISIAYLTHSRAVLTCSIKYIRKHYYLLRAVQFIYIVAIYDALYLKSLIDTYDLTSKKHVLCMQIESARGGLSRAACGINTRAQTSFVEM